MPGMNTKKMNAPQKALIPRSVSAPLRVTNQSLTMNTCDGSRIWYSPTIGVIVSEAKVALSIVERSHQQIARLEVHGRMKGPWWTFSEAGCVLLYIDELVRW
jgi:hypothetical protein